MSRSLVAETSEASWAQHGMWITERAGLGSTGGSGGTVHRMPFTVGFEGPLDVAAMLAACAAVVRRHRVLSAALAERDGGLSLVTGAREVPITQEEAEDSLDLEHGPLARFTLLRLGPAHHRLLFVAHHAVFDGMSKDLLLRDLAAAYRGEPLAPLPISYGEAVRQERHRAAARLGEAAEFWRPRWRDEPSLRLPGLTGVSLRAAPGEAVDLNLGGEVAEIAERLGVTRFEALLALLRLLLHGYGNERAPVAVDVSTRTGSTREHLGLFVNELPVEVAPHGTFAEFARSVRAELRAAYAYRDIPPARALGGISPRSALTPVSMSYRSRQEPGPLFPGLRVDVDWMVFNGAVRNTLHLQAVESSSGIEARLQFNPLLLGRAACLRVADDLSALLRGVADRPEAPIEELPLPGRVEPAGSTRPAGAEPVASGGPDLQVVTEIWCEVLRTPDIGPDDDLFDLGGHSLSITQIVARVRERTGVELSFEVFVDTPTVAGVTAEIARTRQATR